MASTTAKGSGSTVNNGATVLAAGTPGSDSPVTQVLNLNDLNTGVDYGSKVVTNATTGAAGYIDPMGVTKVYSAGTFAYTPAKGTNYVMRAAGDNTAINGSASSLLRVPGGVNTDGNTYELLTTRQMGTYATATFNVLALPSSGVVPGRTKGTNAGTAVTYAAPSGDGSYPATDDEATASRSVPGEFTYMFGGKDPQQDNYKARNSYES